MNDDQINFRILLRNPKYPIIVVVEDDLWSAYNIEQLGTICIMSAPCRDDNKIKVIDTNGEEF